MKKIIFIIFFLTLVFNVNTIYASENDEVIQEAEKELGIAEFIQEAQKYTKDSFEGVELDDIYKDALSGKMNENGIINKIFKILGNEVTKTIRSLGYILIIIVIHSLIKSISEGMGNNEIGEITYYVQYVLIITLIMSNFTETISMIRDTINNLVGFINCLLPILLSLMITTRKLSYCISCRAYFIINNFFHRKFYNYISFTANISSVLH